MTLTPKFELIPTKGFAYKVESYTPVGDGHNFRLSFPNGYGASLSCHEGSYGGREGLWEVAVLKGEEIVYDTPITSDVLGWLSKEEVLQTVVRISKL